MSEVVRGILPPPVEGGTGSYGSRGRIIDRLMGDRKIRARVLEASEALFLHSKFSDNGPTRPSAADPPPTQLPPPVPGGTGVESRGRRDSGPGRPRQAR
jgi:hypothetical protein